MQYCHPSKKPAKYAKAYHRTTTGPTAIATGSIFGKSKAINTRYILLTHHHNQRKIKQLAILIILHQIVLHKLSHAIFEIGHWLIISHRAQFRNIGLRIILILVPQTLRHIDICDFRRFITSSKQSMRDIFKCPRLTASDII